MVSESREGDLRSSLSLVRRKHKKMECYASQKIQYIKEGVINPPDFYKEIRTKK